MRRSSRALTRLLLTFTLSSLTSCGGGGGGGEFENCGNSVLDDGEACDDGNQLDVDGCLGTCVLASCGDGFVDAGVEQCEIGVLGDATCQSEGFTSGSLACGAGCVFDTSGCAGSGGSPTPILPTPTAGLGIPTPTATDAVPVPTPTPRDGGGSCNAGEAVIVVAALDASYGAARIDLSYPASILIPGSDTAASVGERVTFAATGLTTVSDDDNTATLTASLVSFTDNPAGTFATVTFDCVNGKPSPSELTCTVVSASTAGGVAIPDVGCAITVQ